MDSKLITPKPNMYADVQPRLGAAGDRVGVDGQQFFQAIAENFIFQRTDIDLSLIKKDSWVVEFFSNEYYPDRKFASWNDSVILIFDNNTLSFITLKNEYKGKFLNKIGIGDKVDLLLDQFYLHFYCEKHILAFKSENRQVIEKYLFDNELYDLDIDNDYDIMGIIDDIDNLKYRTSA